MNTIKDFLYKVVFLLYQWPTFEIKMLQICRRFVDGVVGESRILLEFRRYAGHSKWQNIKHIKALKDAQKASTSTRITRLIRIAIQEGKSADPKSNIQLAHAIEMGRKNNVPLATIENAMKLGMGSGADSKPALLELKGPAGSTLLLQLLTDNFKRTKTVLFTAVKKTCVSVTDGSGREFEQKGVIVAKPPQGINLETAEEHAIECDAEDVQGDPENQLMKFTCTVDKVYSIKNKLEQLGYDVSSAERVYLAKVRVVLSDTDLENMEIVYQKLEQIPEVVNIYDNIA